MKKLELEKLKQEHLYEELKKADNAEHYYQMNTVFETSALICFLATFVMIAVSSFAELIVSNTNDMLISFVVITFILSAIIFMMISINYKNKTIKVLDNYYKNLEEK